MPHPNHGPGRSRPAGRHRNGGPAPRADGHAPATTTCRQPVRRAVSDGCPLPLTVWRCGTEPVDTITGWPQLVIEKIATSFSAPADLVVLLAPTDGQNGLGTGSLPGRQRALGSVAARVERLGRRIRVLPADPDAWDIATGDTNQGLSDTAGLVIATRSPRQVPDRAAVRSWAELLRPGGVLAVLTHTGHDRGRLVDPTGALVAAAQDADLLYLQHIVVLPTGTTDTTTVPTPGQMNGSRPHLQGTDGERRLRHRRVHADLLVFLHTGAKPATNPAAVRR